MNAEFVRFAIVGGIAAVVNILTRSVLSSFIRFEIAVVISYFVGMVTAFILIRQFVFAPSDRHIKNEAIRFGLVNLLALAQVWVISVGLAEWILPWIGLVWQKYLIAHIAGVVSPIATSYFGHKKFTFG